VEVVEMKVAHIPGIGTAAEGADECMRHARNAAQMYVAAGRNVADGFVGGYVFDCFHWLYFLFLQ
jgi:hypothetical protein